MGFFGRRSVTLGLVVVSCLALTATAYVLGRGIKSPDQRAAEAAPPEYTATTAEVEQRVVQETLQLRGEASFADGSQVIAGEVADVGRLVITEVNADAGVEVGNGEILIAVSSRPVFVLEGGIFAFRDLRPGMEGDDVAQLQDALVSLDYEIWDDSGHYGASTAAAVQSFYTDRGFSPLHAGDEEALTGARQSLEDAEASLAEATAQGAENQDLDLLSEAVDEAKAVLADLEEQTGPMVPLSEVVFASGLPVRVERVAVDVNDVVHPGDVLVDLAYGSLEISAEISSMDASKVEPGMKVTLSVGGEDVGGEVLELEQPEAATDDRSEVNPILQVKADISEEWIGRDVWLTVILSESEGEVLAVPQSAVYTAADGTTSVLIQADTGSVKVPVELGVAGDGYLEVISNELEAGDVVVVGQR